MNYSRPWMYCGLMLMAAGMFMLWQQDRQPTAQAEPPKTAEQPSDAPSAWKSLFDGKTLTGWKVPQFGGEGKVYVKDGQIVMEMGSMMTGITWTGDVIRDNYELELEGMRLDGSDFFCTTTFPVGKDPCSLVVGGWGGALVGLSSIDYADASENSTMRTMAFKNDKWYPIRIRVSDAAVQAWIDGERVVNQPRKGHKFTIRIEVDACRPLGISTYATKGAVRNIRLRPLKPEEIQAAQEEADQAAEDQ
jgi:hypothetical protein